MTDQIQANAVYALAHAGTTLYAARASGLYRSRDGGVNWQNTFINNDQPIAVTAVAVAGNVVLAGVNGAVARSEDDGANWQLIALAAPPPLVTALAASPNFAVDGVIAAATAQDGVFVSTDRGVNWTAWNFGLIDRNVYALVIAPDFAHSRTMLVGTESGIFRSVNGGRGWHEVDFPMDAAPVLSLGCVPNGRLFAGTERNGLLVSDDNGLSWQPVNLDSPTTAINAIAASAPATIWVLQEDKLLGSADNGRTWAIHTTFSPDKLALSLAIESTAIRVGFADGDILTIQ